MYTQSPIPYSDIEVQHPVKFPVAPFQSIALAHILSRGLVLTVSVFHTLVSAFLMLV